MRILICIVLMLSGTQQWAAAQSIRLPDNPLQGRIVFEEKGCIECHAVGGYGGSTGPDLSLDHSFGSFLDLSAMIWNHLPQMDRRFRQLGMRRPTLSEAEFIDLAGFIYYLKYLGRPGSVARGAELVDSKGCLACHSGGRGGAPDFATVDETASPIFVVQSMWNHGPEMSEAISRMGMEFPTLSGQDVADITSYLRLAAAQVSEIRMSPGSPTVGQRLFAEKSCTDCHSVAGGEDKLGPDLSEFDMRQSVTEIASAMWNHSPGMIEYVRTGQIEWPTLEGTEMADVLAYLYFLGFQGDQGDSQNGSFVFDYKGCVRCHASDGDGAGTDPADFPRLDSPVRLVQLMWNHAPEMEDEILIRNESWPQLSKREMEDLYAFLKALQEE